MRLKVPKLPQLLERKIYKTGQTRGADDDVIFQNRVGRNSTVLIPYQFWNKSFISPANENPFENGFIVLIPPKIYFKNSDINNIIKNQLLEIGRNCLVFYETREDWDNFNPDKLNWQSAQNRKSPLGGNYVARVPATTATTSGEKIVRGFTTSTNKGAGIRLYEYANSGTIVNCRVQLESFYWMCFDSIEVVTENKMNEKDAEARKTSILKLCEDNGLLNFKNLKQSRMIDKNNNTICPLCLERLSGKGFFKRITQAEGREVPDLTVTEISLFHINELRYGVFNHRPYNLGWGHHHCNIVTKDTGISETIIWMKKILKKNEDEGFLF